MNTAYFVSDLHLKNRDETNALVFLEFIQELIRRATAFGPALRPSLAEQDGRPSHLFLVGDIFDLWIGDHLFFRDQFTDLVDALKALHESGVEIHFFEGNHDLHLRRFWQETLGFRVHEERECFELQNLKVRVEHGDLMNPDDRGYLFLRWFLRTPLMRWLALHLPSFAVRAIGERASRSSRTYTSTRKELPRDRIQAITRLHAKRASAEEVFDLLISGHVHVRDDHTFPVDDRSVRSVNLGSWYDPPCVFVLDQRGGRFENLPLTPISTINP